MAYTTVPQLLADVDQISFSPPRDAALGMKIQHIRFRGAPLQLKPSDDANLTIPFEPSVYGGGSDPRKPIVFNIPEPLFEAMAALEDWCRQVLEEAHPTIQAMWTTSIKPGEQYEARLKAKINVSGARQARFYDHAAQPTEPPAVWKGLKANAILGVRGVYIQKHSVGLLLEVTDLRYVHPPEQECPF